MKEDYLNLMRDRETIYRLLARLYRKEIDGELLESLETMPVDAKNTEFDFRDGARKMKSAIQASNDPLTDFAVDYARIFLGAGIATGVVAYPYESVFTSRDRLVMQEAWEQVLAIYKENGIGKTETDLYEDHVGLELEFMAILCERAGKLIEAGRQEDLERNLDLQKDFLEHHLLNWVPMLTKTMRECPGSNFYKGVALMTDAFLKTEEELFSI